MGCLNVLVVLLAVLVGYLIGTSPQAVAPPLVPAASPMSEVPPWPIFRVAVALNDAFRAAAEATTLPKIRVIELATARWHSQIIYGLTKRGVFDAVHGTPLTCKEAAETLKLHQPFLCRLMRAGETLGLLTQAGDSKFGTTATSAQLLAGVEGSQKSFVEMINNPYQQPAWEAIAVGESLSTGASGFEVAHGAKFWEFVTAQPELEAEFDGAMTSFTAAAAASVISSYAFPPEGKICDVDGSEGGTLKLLLQHYPAASGVVLDRPTVATRASEKLAAAGLGGRAAGLGGDFLGASLPAELASCDVFVLKHILHDWDDAACATILRNIAAVGRAGAKVAIVEHVLGVSGAGMERAKAMMDINMLASCPSGAKERSVAEYDALAAAAGISGAATLYQMRDILSLVEYSL